MPDWERVVDRLDHRIDDLCKDLKHLDETGSRGVAVLQIQVNALTAQVASLSSRLENEMRSARMSRIQGFAVFVGAMVPVYLDLILNWK